MSFVGSSGKRGPTGPIGRPGPPGLPPKFQVRGFKGVSGKDGVDFCEIPIVAAETISIPGNNNTPATAIPVSVGTYSTVFQGSPIASTGMFYVSLPNGTCNGQVKVIRIEGVGAMISMIVTPNSGTSQTLVVSGSDPFASVTYVWNGTNWSITAIEN